MSNINYEHCMKQTLDLAKELYKKGNFPVACTIVYNNKILVTSSIEDQKSLLSNELQHAEIIALHKLYNLKESIDKNKCILFCTLEPCLMCYGTIVHAGIGNIVYGYEDIMAGGTKLDIKSLSPFYNSKKINIASGVLRGECLSLFKSFFLNPNEEYLKGSLLAEYTLKQK